MPLSIKNAELERLARQLADETGESITEVIREALEQKARRVKKQRQQRVLASQIAEIFHRLDAMPRLDTRTDDEILGYDEHGIPH